MVIGILIAANCSLEKKNGFDRTMQNLTAHYNILFDANEILRQKQDDYALAFIDSYNEILNVYQDTTAKTATPDKDLLSAIEKANKIINLKEQSHYLGDAYLVLGKANFLGGDYFNASEYFSYVIRSYPKQTDLVQEALIWKARALLYLNFPSQAKPVLDTALQNLNPKKGALASGYYAAKLQYDINVQDYADGEAMAKLAISFCGDKKLRLRWTFILAQLQELNNKNSDAFANYSTIAKSNADFEMAFNADLNRIRMDDVRNGIKLSRVERLQSLLKNPNNKEFKDQIYYQIGQIHFIDKDIDNAVKNYKLSVRNSLKNQNQKGLSYLRIADINFNNKADYVTAKKYYDSTLNTLSPNYPGYQLIQKKTNNLQLLTDRLQIISREDTLQMLARLDEKTRQTRIDAMVQNEILQQQNATTSAAAAAANASNTAPGTVFNTPGGSNFYFYNSNAVSQGYNDFKRIWGNRKLEDNWRRSNRSTSDQTNSSLNPSHNVNSDVPGDPFETTKTQVTAGNYRQQIVQNLPLTPELLAQSNLRIYNALFDMASFYRDILEDKKEAVITFERILARFPNNPNLPAIYYSLYRLYTDLVDPKADIYKNKLLKDYAETPFAKVIVDPDYSKKLGDNDAAFNTLYSQAYDMYAHKKYADVVTQVDKILKQYPNSGYSAQLYYLRAISAGHQESVVPFKNDLQQIATNYPNDKLITPLVNQHINYINANLVDMSGRHFALNSSDTSDIPFTPPMLNQKQTPYLRPGYHPYFATIADVRKPEKKEEPVKKEAAAAPAVAAPVVPDQPVVKKPVLSTVFSMRDSTEYFFVVNISNDNTNLASSRFGIGQFIRANYPNSTIRHGLMDVGDSNRLIYVGKFFSLNSVKDYARAIIPVMPEIMKIGKDKYSFFVITKQNLDKLANKKMLDSYIDYYQSNY